MAELDAARFNDGLLAFLTRASTPFHAVEAMGDALLEAGFVRLQESEPWVLEPGGRYLLTRNGSSLIAFVHGRQSPPRDGLRMVGAHTDSPCLMVKPNPDQTREGCYQLGVEVYGGALLNPWFDRDLSLAGRVSFSRRDGTIASALVDLRRPVAIIPSLAIHLDREANSNRKVNPQTDILPLLSLPGAEEAPELGKLLTGALAEAGHHDVARVHAYELNLYDTQPPALLGLHRDFIAGARLDNLLSCYTGLQALLAADGQQSTLLVCNDHEEVGSVSAVGAQGPMLRGVLDRLAGDAAGYGRLVDRSMLISADNAHAVHPNYADRHDGKHGPRLNGGPVVKLNVNQRYASNSETSALFRQLAAALDLPLQSFVTRTDMACGSTIGPLTAAEVGVRTLDVGVPTFAMHSVRETAGSRDAHALYRLLRAFFDTPGALFGPG